METSQRDVPQTKDTFSTLLVVSGSVLYSSKSLFVKHLMGLGALSGDILSLRLAWAAPVYLVILLWSLARKPAAWADLAKMAALGCLGFWIAPRLNFAGLGHTSAGLERILVQSSTAFVLILVAMQLRRAPRPWVLASVFVCYAGMLLALTGRDEGHAFADPVGAGLILAAALAWAIFIVAVGKLQRRLGVGLSTSVAMTAATLPALLESLARGREALVVATPGPWLAPLLGLVVIGTLVPSFLAQAGLARCGPERASILSLSGPALLPLMANWSLGEAMPWQQIAGLGTVLAACVAMSWGDRSASRGSTS